MRQSGDDGSCVASLEPHEVPARCECRYNEAERVLGTTRLKTTTGTRRREGSGWARSEVGWIPEVGSGTLGRGSEDKDLEKRRGGVKPLHSWAGALSSCFPRYYKRPPARWKWNPAQPSSCPKNQSPQSPPDKWPQVRQIEACNRAGASSRLQTPNGSRLERPGREWLTMVRYPAVGLRCHAAEQSRNKATAQKTSPDEGR